MTEPMSLEETRERVAEEEAAEVRGAIKVLKTRFDDRRQVDALAPILFRGALRSPHEAFVAHNAEILHQLALVAERRGDFPAALGLYRKSQIAFKEREVPCSLGLAREARDCGFMLCRTGEPETGLKLVHEAVELHADDRLNNKGWRQLRITQAYQLRAQILAGENVEQAIRQLIEVALEGCQDFCLRDQFFLVSFARSYASGASKCALDMRLVEINARRVRPIGTAKSISRVVIGTELAAIKAAMNIALGKE